MGKGKIIAGIALLAVALVFFIFFMLPYFMPSERPEPEKPECIVGKVYTEQSVIDEYGLYNLPSKDNCTCSSISEWIKEASNGGWLCIPIDESRPDCEHGVYLSVTDCDCEPPMIWYSGDDGITWTCDE